ncbi:non-homologous end-joining DNA ligase [Fictibacillus phosphorivorans]|uniref:non-homologous end-joining DNA ligase n=1 Tax=Fictibacillus phosphorivorans TaxID=1221500 RepID=UPI00203F4D32|nr:non-homologous end-joining DNA ligase [Fictibacillus phosphorivorans]MCM3719079.1 non-homologous end-joining DNA ligase [Fictibacillus phosphorivorans]MCM3776701.1 non-homologous end-joining DNA ligase [Fictibacillus phosphorivorans]
MISAFLKPMLPSLSDKLPVGEDWVFEVKYDGFRCLLYWDHSKIVMTSRNGHYLHTIFPEIPDYLKGIENKVNHLFPLLIDGELCILENPFKANFEQIQKRGRLKQHERIQQAIKLYPSSFCAFDLLALQGRYMSHEPFIYRKEMLSELMKTLLIDTEKVIPSSHLNFIPYTKDREDIEQTVRLSKSEGIVAKKIKSKWLSGTRTNHWIKVKNLTYSNFILMGYDTENGFFHVGVIKDDQIMFVGLFSHGISPEEKEALIQIVKKNQSGRSNSIILIEPSLCVELSFLEVYKNQLRQPRFVRFRFDADWEDCTWENLQKNL